MIKYSFEVPSYKKDFYQVCHIATIASTWSIKIYIYQNFRKSRLVETKGIRSYLVQTETLSITESEVLCVLSPIASSFAKSVRYNVE